MVGFLQRSGYSPRWRLLWHVAHIEARRAGQMLVARNRSMLKRKKRSMIYHLQREINTTIQGNLTVT